MKRSIYINSVGPIVNEVKLELRRFNVFIGQQSSGKSTIAKLISTFSWLEKEACTTLSENVLPDKKDFITFIEDYHRIHGYFDEDKSVVKYESDYVTIVYDKGNFSVVLKPNCTDYQRVKVSYVPSDRNVITLKDIEKRELGDTNFRSFLFDWLEARRAFDPQSMADMLSLDVKYYYDKERTQYQDRITHHNGQSYDISLYDASSGLQSAVPLVVLLTYLKEMYYENYGKEISFESQKRESKLIIRLIERLLMPFVDALPGESPVDVFKRTSKELESGKMHYAIYFQNIRKALDSLNEPHSISHIIEEPEQNLFPQTQGDLIQYIISSCNITDHLSSAVITTHSPYLLAMLNVLIMAGILLESGVDKNQINDILPINSAIRPLEIGVYTVGDGSCKSIINDVTGLIDQNHLDTASEYNASIFDQLYRMYIKSLKK
jgi:predicted ATP-dependent endonuclease of OLD family